MKKHWVMDYETLVNCFCAVFIEHKTDEIKIFRIDKFKNEIIPFLDFLKTNIKNKERHIHFNGLAFDSQITEFILDNELYFSQLKNEELANIIYKYSQKVIKKSKNKEWLDYPEFKMRILQLDLFKLNHWDNPQKRSSLKWIEFSMDWYNLKDMPIHHSTKIETQDQIDEIINYCINDVKATKNILYLSKKEINLRNKLSKQYKINLYSASEPKISKELFLHFLSKKTNKPKKYFKYKKTYRKEIVVKDIILPYITFKRNNFKVIHEKFKSLIIDPLKMKGAIKLSLKQEDVTIDFGLGGIHGASKQGIYEENEDLIIMSSDVKSYYPNLSIRNKWSPAHIPNKIFYDLYEWFYNERIKIPKTDIRNYIYKIILNATYGLSNEKHSFLYDPEFTMRNTINGQLSLLMLYERLLEGIPGSKLIMINTDGLEMHIPRNQKDKYMEICKNWETLTKMVLEHETYQKIILSDVNNYIGVHPYEEITKEKYEKRTEFSLMKKENGKYYEAKTKCKGRYAFEEIPLHKNKSSLIIRKAVYNFFLLNKTPETTIEENKNIFDYCIGKKIKGDWYFEERYIEKGIYKKKKQQKVIRYYVSKEGSKIIKCNKTDGREIQVESGRWLSKIFNKVEKKEWKDYKIENSYYIKNIYDEINNILSNKENQLTLF
jgi:hypothetical protein